MFKKIRLWSIESRIKALEQREADLRGELKAIQFKALPLLRQRRNLILFGDKNARRI